MSRRDERKRSLSPGGRDFDGGSKRMRYDGDHREDVGPPRDRWQEERRRDSQQEPYRDAHRDGHRYSPRRGSPPRRSDSRREDLGPHRGPGQGFQQQGDFPGPGPPQGSFSMQQGNMGGPGPPGPPGPPGAPPGSFRGRGDFQGFNRGRFDGGRGTFFRGRGREFVPRAPFQEAFRGRGRFRGRFDDFGRRGRFIPRGRGSPYGGRDGPAHQDGPKPPAVDPAIEERRKQSTARLMARQLAHIELNPDLLDEQLYERFLELKGPQGAEAAGQLRVEDAFMWECLSSAETGQDAVPQQAYDQSEAFEGCLHLYQSAPEVRASKAGSYIV